jgi:hypothetical protein
LKFTNDGDQDVHDVEWRWGLTDSGQAVNNPFPVALFPHGTERRVFINLNQRGGNYVVDATWKDVERREHKLSFNLSWM